MASDIIPPHPRQAKNLPSQARPLKCQGRFESSSGRRTNATAPAHPPRAANRPFREGLTRSGPGTDRPADRSSSSRTAAAVIYWFRVPCYSEQRAAVDHLQHDFERVLTSSSPPPSATTARSKHRQLRHRLPRPRARRRFFSAETFAPKRLKSRVGARACVSSQTDCSVATTCPSLSTAPSMGTPSSMARIVIRARRGAERKRQAMSDGASCETCTSGDRLCVLGSPGAETLQQLHAAKRERERARIAGRRPCRAGARRTA